MKYTQKCQDFQRYGGCWRFMFLLFGLASAVKAQEIVWPVPSAATEYLAGMQTNVESYDQYFVPLHAVTLFAGPRSSAGLFYGKLSSGWRSSEQGIQAEVELYPMFGTSSYGYVGYAYGFSAPFPLHRGGMEYFFSLPSSYEASAGMRVFQFRDRRTVVLGTGTVNRYIGNFWLSARPYLAVNQQRRSASATFTGRYYPGEREEFWFGRVGAGFTPDERSTLTTSGMQGSELFTLHSQSIGIGGQRWVTERALVNVDLSLTRQEVAFRRGTYVLNASLWCGVRFSW